MISIKRTSSENPIFCSLIELLDKDLGKDLSKKFS
jgi:hypothetical protein